MRVYERTYRGLAGVNGMRNCFTLPFFAEGFLQKVVIQQTGGPLVDFQANIYNARFACVGSSSSGGGNGGGDYNSAPEHYRVIDTIQGVAGESALFLATTGHGYVNRDGTYSNPVQRIYVEISAADGLPGGQASTWDVTIGGYEDVGP